MLDTSHKQCRTFSPLHSSSVSVGFHGSCCPLLIQIIQIAPMPVVQPQLPQGGAVHPASAFPVTMGTAAVVAPGSAPSQAVLLPPAHTRYKVNWYSVFALFIFATFSTGTAQ